ncbi:MAG: EAL domain-containing protein [Phycisphaeraceae bacterium]|nr:EAL domain-containing protein [Phycisphaeraceae bacterium]
MPDPDTQTADVPATSDASRVRRLIADGAIRAVFQPIVDLSRGEIFAYEVLSRPDLDSGFDSPADLFRAAQETGQLWELESVTRRISLQAATKWPANVKLFLNCTPEVFGDPRFVPALEHDILACTADAGVTLPPERLVIEITEQASELAIESLRHHLDRLRSLHIDLAIDDVGVGSSGLSRIMLFRPQWLKLDRGFLDQIDSDRLKQNMVRFLVHFARLSGVKVLAEGIETQDELTALIGLGVRYGQGYYLGRPAPRGESIDPEVGAWAKTRWAKAADQVGESLHQATVARLCRPATLVQPTSSSTDAAAMLDAEPTHAGVVVFDGRRVVAAMSRRTVIELTRNPATAEASILQATSQVCVAPSDATLAEALHLLAARPDNELASPIVILDGAQVMGLVSVQELLGAAASLRSGESGSRFGLPGRDEAERRFAELIDAAQSPGVSHFADHCDAAFVDIRRHSDLAGAFGGQEADRIVSKLADLIRTSILQSVRASSAWHLGGDRFLLCAPPGSLAQPLRRLVDRFDSTLHDRTCVQPPSAMPVSAPRATIRALLIPGAVGRVSCVSDLYLIEQQLRRRARTMEHTGQTARSLLIADHRLQRPAARLSA